MAGKLLDIKQCLLLTVKEKEEQIAIRHELLKVMVGTVYPGIIRDEIYQIKMSIQ